MSAILTSDVHLNDKPGDEYRWGLFDWLLCQQADELIICGDLTDAKDRHGAKLVNRLHANVLRLEERFRVIILKGNHDYYDADHPFFEFLGSSSDIAFVADVRKIKLSIGSALFVPAGVRWDFDIPKVDYLFTHATFSGAKAENGRSLTGVDPAVLRGFRGKVWSGDIHVPQTLAGGKIEYVGAPYHTRFGDDFEPRVVRVDDDGRATDLHFPAPRKVSLTIAEPDNLRRSDAREGDHVKIRCTLRRADYVKWRVYREEIRRVADEFGWKLFGIDPVALDIESVVPKSNGVRISDPEELVADYAKRKRADRAHLDMAQQIIKGIRS